MALVRNGMVIMVIALCAVIASKGYAGEKQAYVELSTLFDNYEKTKDADAKLTELANQKQLDRDALVENVRRMKDEMVVLADNGEEKIKKQAEIDQKIKELQGFDEASREELRAIRDNNVQEIFDDLNAVIEKYGKKNKYDFIFSDRAFVYKNEKYNITDDVLGELNKK